MEKLKAISEGVADSEESRGDLSPEQIESLERVKDFVLKTDTFDTDPDDPESGRDSFAVLNFGNKDFVKKNGGTELDRTATAPYYWIVRNTLNGENTPFPVSLKSNEQDGEFARMVAREIQKRINKGDVGENSALKTDPSCQEWASAQHHKSIDAEGWGKLSESSN